MKKLFLSAIFAASVSILSLSAQEKAFTSLGLDLSVSTTGVGLELATPVGDYLQLRGGMSFIPGLAYSFNIDGSVDATTPLGTTETIDYDMKVNCGFARTQGDILLNVYPFGSRSSFFITTGLYFGGKSIIGIDGHSDKLEEVKKSGTFKEYAEQIKVDSNGNIYGSIAANGLRPYLGLGFGRPCSRKHAGFMFEAGVQYMGQIRAYEGMGYDNPLDLSSMLDADLLSYVGKIPVYPVIKLTVTSRLFDIRK